MESTDFPGSLVVKIHASSGRGVGLVPGWGTQISHATRCSQEKKERKKEIQKPYSKVKRKNQQAQEKASSMSESQRNDKE